MTVVPHGPDTIETWRSGCVFFPCALCLGPFADGEVQTRNPGTNAFRDPQNPDPNNVMTFSADGTAKQGCGNFKKRRTSQKRAFQKVDARDLAGKWRGCFCHPLVYSWPFSPVFCTTKTALNEDQYEESGRIGFLLTLCLPLIPVEFGTRTRKYVNGHATNGFALDGNSEYLFDEKAHLDRDPGKPDEILWYRDPGCAANGCFFAKKVG